MKLKRLLTYGIMAAFSTAPMLADLETIEVSSQVPTPLDYKKAQIDAKGVRDDEKKESGSALTYQLKVEEEGDYIVYINVTEKIKSYKGMEFDIVIGNDDTNTVYVKDETDCRGNWNTFLMYPVKVHLPKGDNISFKFVVKDNSEYYRYKFNNDWPPVLVHANLADELGDEPKDINVLFADPSSSKYWTSCTLFNTPDGAQFGQDGQIYDVDKGIESGDEKSVVISNYEVTGSSNTPLGKTKLRYLVNVTKEGDYPVTLKGFYIPNRTNNGDWQLAADKISGYSLNIRSTWGDGSIEYSNDQINFEDFPLTEYNSFNSEGKLSKDLEDTKAKGTLHLKKGTYFLEVYSEYEGEDFFCLRTLTIGAPENGNKDAEPVGQHVPVVTFDEVKDVYFGHEFTISGKITLDQEGDEFDSATIQIGDGEAIDLDVKEDEKYTFSYTVKDEEFKEEGEKTFTVVAKAKDGDQEYKGTAELVVDLQKKVFEITAIAGDNGSISFVGDKKTVEEGDDITVTITPDEGYEIVSVKVEQDDVTKDVELDEKGVGTYTFKNVKADQTIEATFALKVYNVTVENVGNGTITTDAANNKVEHGSSLEITVTPNKGYNVTAVIVDDKEVKYTVNDATGVASYTLDKVVDDVKVSAEFELKKYTVSTSVTGNGTVTVEAANANQGVAALAGSKEFEHGTKVVITATPNEGHKIKSITINGTALADVVVTGHSYTIESVEENHEIAVTFEEDKSSGIYGLGADGISYSVVDGGIIVRTDAEANVILIDLSGKVLYQGYVNGEAYISTGAKGVNVLKVSTANSTLSVKVVL